MSKKFSSTIASASLIIIFFGLISKGLGFVREIVFAGSFGLSKDFDIYLVGSVIPTLINTAIIYLGQNFFIPSYNKIKSEKGDTVTFFNTFLWLFVFSGIVLAAILFFFSDFIIELYLANSSFAIQSVASNIFKIFVVSIPFNAAVALIIAFLQAEFEFKAPAVSQLWVNISVIVLTLLFSGKINVYIIPLGFIIGTALQLVYLLVKVKKNIKFELPHVSKARTLISITSSTLLMTIFIEIISQFYILADRFFIKSVDTGGIAALNYAQNLFILPVSIFSIALSTAIFPSFSQRYHLNKGEELNNSLISALNINVFLSLPLTFLFGFFGIYIISLFYQTGNFNYKDTITTFNVLRILSFSLLFYAAYSVLNKLIYGMGALKFLFVITIIGITIKFLFNLLLVSSLKQNGLALSTSFTYIFFFLASIFYSKWKLRSLALGDFIKDTFLTLLNSAVSFLFVTILANNLGAPNLIEIICLIITFIVIYIVNSFLLGQKSVLLLKSVYSNYMLNS